ncbi:MAG: hypothetical protein AABZ53_01305 [Planctomycetota bacterium]
MQRIPVVFGGSFALAITGAACAQVNIVSVARSTHIGVCVHVPPDNPNWCSSFDDSNATTGLWSTGGSFGPGASNETGHANGAVWGGQYGTVTTSYFDVSCQSDVWVESGGTGCSSDAAATSSMVVRFDVGSPTFASIDGAITNVGGSASVVIAPVAGGISYSSTAPSFNTQVLLAPGQYEFRAGTAASSACAGACEHNLVVRMNSRVYFDPAPCAADFDGDGTADFFDYDAYVVCFEGGACPPGKSADFDADGTVDFFDYDAFVVSFESGC